MFGRLVDWQNVTLQSDPHPLQVLPLPKENVPPGFTGAVGNYTVTITASPTGDIAAGDPITVKVQITGRGSLESVTLPSQTGWEQFKIYPPTSDFQPAGSDPLGMSGIADICAHRGAANDGLSGNCRHTCSVILTPTRRVIAR